MQSATRNSTNTNYGQRGKLIGGLDRSGEIMDKLAGQALHPYEPRALQKYLAGGTAIAAIGNPWYLAALPFQSPRLVGEAAHALGKGAKLSDRLIKSMNITPARARALGMTSFQSGRLSDELENRRKK